METVLDETNVFETFRKIINFKLIDTDTIDITVGTFALLLIVLILTSFLLKLIRMVVTRKLPLEDKNRFISFFQFIRYIVFIFAVIFALDVSGVNMSVLLTASAALLVGLGFALQQLFQDIISGVLIILDQSLHVGDIVEVDGKVGKVLEIKLRTTRVVTRNDRVMVIPNHKFMMDTLFNWTQNSFTNREQVDVGVAYGSDVELVRKLLLQCAQKADNVLNEPEPLVLFEDFADSSLNFSLYFYVSDGMQSPKIKSDLRFSIDAIFRQNNISIPFPQRDVHIIKQ
ncbi:MAG: mechanosensitive ion channel protein MscS [Flavobacterium sp.]|uniref:mechanosensitive ion channel family protein n=1 Tax=unclassified Flavobacterium TaxID=196869 RepID=UPI000C4CBF8D|nr:MULTISPECIES: mechanosensitive ion channel domain-containing protein [unclassified Flavobacterium]MBF02916.1 mechanosensitive ion channel protein MscS [Flavobacterium sp.]MCO6162755.1 mechanosensitive ion channel [Flavobacterium sp. NRK F7]|tara:strand:+ start:399 stop:1253 length:855 start_codon:yes stop_codon:yes gene_type:complete